jgi:glycosyltransferase involved in cell wall biosynthesis
MPSLVLIVPGALETPTGGYVYDRRIVRGLRARGCSITVRQLDASFPYPSEDARAEAVRVLADIPSGSTVLVDGLALGVLPDEAAREADRLRLIALIHHPLARETGIAPEVAAALEESERRALASAARIIVTSRQTADGLRSYGVGAGRVLVVEPGFDRAPLAQGSPEHNRELLCVATLTPRKGHEILLDALAAISELPWRLTCVGSVTRHPETAERLRKRLRASGWTDRVALTGEVEPEAVAAFYDRADVFVFPTLYEGYGMAVAEALARGLPVVGTACGAIPDLVGERAGIIVPPGDLHALAAALRRILSDATLREGLRQGAAAVRERLATWNDAAAAMEAALFG